MDLPTIMSFRSASTREDLLTSPGETFIAGGTWLMSEPQPATTGLIDLMTMGWPEIEFAEHGVRIAATCTIAHLVAWSRAEVEPAPPAEWTALSLIPEAANALLASFKIWNTATVGGNICRSFAAAAMVSLAAALDGVAEIWTPDGGERRILVADLVTGNGTNDLAPGEVLRSVFLPSSALGSRALLRKIALAEHGRSGAVVTGRVDRGGPTVFTVTAATSAPVVLRFPHAPDREALARAVGEASGYYTDALGAAPWRRAVSIVLAERIRVELLGAPA